MKPLITTIADEDLRPTPLIKAWVDWTLEGADRKQPVLSLWGAISGLSLVMGRHFTFNYLHANQYMIAVGPTGCGKDRIVTATEQIITKCAHAGFLGGSTFGSGAGILTALEQCCQRIWVIDEIHIQLSKISRVNTNNYEAEVMSLLLSLYSGKAYNGKELKSGNEGRVRQPYVNLLGFTQPSSIWPVMSNIKSNGAAGRFLYCQVSGAVPTNLDKRITEVPSVIEEHFTKFYEAKGKSYVALNGPLGNVPSQEMKISDEGQSFRRELIARRDRVRMENDGDDHWFEMNARVVEHIYKLAMLHAWSLDPIDPIITDIGLAWGERIVNASIQTLADGLSSGVQNAQLEGALGTIEHYIRVNKKVSSTELYRKFRGVPGYDNILDGLTRNEIVRVELSDRKGPGRKSKFYIYNLEQQEI